MESSAKVLITGIEGFTGFHLSNLMRQKGYTVYGISFIEDNPKKMIYKCDIRNIEAVKNIIGKIIPDYIIHLAGISFVASENIQEIYSVNVQGALNIFDACLDLNISPRKIVMASSATVYGNQSAQVLSEDMCPLPNSHYANSKLVMENMARTYYQELNIFIVRPFNYTGQGQSSNFVIPKIVRHFRERTPEIELGNINIYREFNDVSYVSALYLEIMTNACTSDYVNFCSGNTVSLLEVLDILTQLTDHQLKVIINPKYVRENEIESLCGSVIKLQGIIGRLPHNVPLVATLSKMLE